MPDWPDAPRLEEALADLATQIDPDSRTKAETAALLALGDTGETIPTLPPVTTASPGRRSSTVIGRLAVAATLLVVAGAIFAVANRVEETQQSDTGISPPADNPEASDPAVMPPPLLTQSDMCLSTGTNDEVRRRLDLAGGAVEVGVRSSRPTPLNNRTLLVIGPGDDWRLVADRTSLHLGIEASAIVYAATSDLDSTSVGQLADQLIANLCEQGPLYLVSIGAPLGIDGACHGGQAASFSGYVFVDHERPPTDCSIRRPTLVFDREDVAARRDAWAEHLGCDLPTTTVDGSSTRVTSWSACRNTLVHVESAMDPWPETIDGVPAVDFILASISVAN